MPTRSSFGFLGRLTLVTSLISTAGACAGQGEGDLCDRNAGGNGSSDCADGLVCTDRPNVVSATHFGVCCPSNAAQATTAACSAAPTMNMNPAPTDGSTGDAAVGTDGSGE